MRVSAVLAITVAIGLVLTAERVGAQEPAYVPGQEPMVLIDRGHHNFMIYRPMNRVSLVNFLESDGYRVRELDGQFDHESLNGVQIVIIAMALAPQNVARDPIRPNPFVSNSPDVAWKLPTPSAFSEDEIAVLSEWVEAGGSLLLVFEHMPLLGAAQDLARVFGIEISNGFAVDGASLPSLEREVVEQAGSVLFSRADETLVEHAVTSGRSQAERVDLIATYTGSAFRLPPGAEPLLTLKPSFVSLLPEVAWQFSEATPREQVGGWSQGGVLRVGQGRVAVFSDSWIVLEMVGYAEPANDPQLLLNVLHWLSGLLDE